MRYYANTIMVKIIVQDKKNARPMSGVSILGGNIILRLCFPLRTS